MTSANIMAFLLGFATATILIGGIGFFWIKRKWKALLFGMGAKLFTRGLNSVKSTQKSDFREVGRQ